MRTQQERVERRFHLHKRTKRALAAALSQAADCELRRDEWRRLTNLSVKIATCATSERLVKIDGTVPRLIVRNERACRSPLCSSCQYRRATEQRRRLEKALNWVWYKNPGLRLLALVLTSANRPLATDLPAMFTDHDRAMRKLWKHRFVQPLLKGHVTSFEVPVRRSPAGLKMAGVHTHSLVLVKADYFDNWISHAVWREIWKHCLGVDYLPMVHVKPADRGPSGDDAAALYANVCEAIKYATKPQSYASHINGNLIIDADVAATLSKVLHGRRMLRHAGLMSLALRAGNPRKETP